MDRIIAEAENFVNAYTGKSWSTSDNQYPKVQTVTRFLTASLVYEGLPSMPETQSKAERYHEKAMAMLMSMRVLDSGPLKRI